MLIVWGTKIRRRSRGFGLHFCPICRAVKPCQIRAVLRVGHVYYIPAGSGEHAHNEVTCPTCSSLYPRALEAPLTEHSEPIVDIPRVLDRLLPDEASPLLARVEAETRIRKLTPDERRIALAEPFVALAYEHAATAQKGWRESLFAIAQLFVICGLVASSILWFTWADKMNDAELLAWSVGTSVGTVLLIAMILWINYTSSRRRAGRSFLPRIAQSLRSLSPSREELDATLALLRSRRDPLASGTDAASLYAAIELANAQPAVH